LKITQKKFQLGFGLILLASIVALALLNSAPAPVHGFQAPLTHQQKASKAGNHYHFFHKNTAKAVFTNERPAKTDRTVLISIAAAFTKLDDNAIEGVYGINGELHNTKAVSNRVGGLFVIHPDGHCSIEGTKMGKAINKKFLKPYAQEGYSVFQQIKIISDGAAAGFKDESKFQRRALALDKSGALSIVESVEAITLAQFASDLVELGVHNAAYTDMGAWDEGWYRDAHGRAKTLGKDRSQTARQSNWLVFKTP